MNCPDIDELLEARAAPGVHAELLAHAGGCPECSRLWAALDLLDAAPAAAAWREVPGRLLDAARAAGRGPSPLARLREVVARLVFDSATAPAAALRGAGPATRHLTYEGAGRQLDLALLGGETLVGQVGGAGASGTVILAGPDGPRWAPLEANGDFRFERVAPGRYLLAVEGERERLLVPELDLGA